MRPGNRLELEAEEIDDLGAGVGDYSGVSVHVPGLAPGESGWVEIEAVSKHHPRAYAQLLQRKGPPSPHRQAPHCQAYGRCGGCRWQHLSYTSQLDHKRRRLAKELPEAAAALLHHVVGADSETGYRNKATYVVDPKGTTLGAREPHSDAIVSTLGCRVVEPVIDETAAAIAALIEGHTAANGPQSQLRYLTLRTDSRNRVIVGVVTTLRPPPSLDALFDEIAALIPVTAIFHAAHNATSGSVFADSTARLVRQKALPMETLSGTDVEVRCGSFLQVNRPQSLRLVAGLATHAQSLGVRTALDLYCGLGPIAFALADLGIRTRGIERSHDADMAAAACDRSGLQNPQFQRGSVEDLHDISGFDLVVVNPPRKGLDNASRELLVTAQPQHLFYLSCGPQSLGRDLRQLVQRGYVIRALEAFDLMPGTAQVECLVHLEREVGAGSEPYP